MFQTLFNCIRFHKTLWNWVFKPSTLSPFTFEKKNGSTFFWVGSGFQDMTVDGKYTNVFFSGALDLYGSIDGIWHDYIWACLEDSGFCAGEASKIGCKKKSPAFFIKNGG